jgi:hypothetical protein
MDRKERRWRERERKKIEEKLKKGALPQNDLQKSAGQELPPTKRYFGLSISKTWASIGGLSTLVGLLLAYLTFRPDISIEPYKLLDPANAFSEQFTVQNNSVYALYDVRATCNIDSMKAGAATFDNVGGAIGVIADRLSPKESTTVDCRSEIYGINQVEITIGLTFKPSYWPADKNLGRRFKGKKDSHGEIEWVHDANPANW